jgi:hypothetical protein
MADEHPVTRKLSTSLVPYFVSGEQLERQRFYRAYSVYTWANEVMAGVAVLGLGPVLSPLNLQTGTVDVPALFKGTQAGSLPFLLAGIGALFGIGWMLFKVYVTRENGIKRAALARSCRNQLRTLETRVHQELNEPNPITKLDEIYASVKDLINRCSQEEAWPWPGPAPNIAEPVEKRVKEYCSQYQANWKIPVLAVEQQNLNP